MVSDSAKEEEWKKAEMNEEGNKSISTHKKWRFNNLQKMKKPSFLISSLYLHNGKLSFAIFALYFLDNRL